MPKDLWKITYKVTFEWIQPLSYELLSSPHEAQHIMISQTPPTISEAQLYVEKQWQNQPNMTNIVIELIKIEPFYP